MPEVAEKMSGRIKKGLSLFIILVIVASLLSSGFIRWIGNPNTAAATGEGRIVVELGGYSYWANTGVGNIRNLNNQTRQAYKYYQVRYGREFYYEFSGLARDRYDVELSFVETQYSRAGSRIFTVSVNGAPVIPSLDVFARAGKNVAYQETIPGVQTVGGLINLGFRASVGEAMVCNIRLISGGQTMVEARALESRLWSYLPPRFIANPEQDIYESVLGRLGSRFMVNPVPQLLGWRQSSLGTLTESLGELVLAFRTPGGQIRCLPFTDRYPLFAKIGQQHALTSITYSCEDPSLPFKVKVRLRAPFYPGDEVLSSVPCFYLDIQVENTGSGQVSGEFLLVRPHQDPDFGGEAPQPLGNGISGYKFTTNYSYGDGSVVLPQSQGDYFTADEAVAIDDPAGFEWHFQQIDDQSWIWPSPSGYPRPYPQKVFTFRPKGYSGGIWDFQLTPSGSANKTLALAAYVGGPVLRVRGDFTYRYIYSDPDEAGFDSVEEVLAYALGPTRGEVEGKSSFFDSLLSASYCQGISGELANLIGLSFQNYLINTWWCYNQRGERWFSVWEGSSCRFHSTIDVEYNTSWFYFAFWPDLLKVTLQEWASFEKSNAQGKYLPHDLGWGTEVFGMAYPHDMPVEENANYLLLLFKYWKTTGDNDFLASQSQHIRDYSYFILACDGDGDGLPDLNTANTIDQGTSTVQFSRNQTYLGIKALAALQAAREMATGFSPPDNELAAACERRVLLINHTLEERLWKGDHFLVCDDPAVPAGERDAYSIYASNGLLYLLSTGSDCGLTAGNLQKLREDLLQAAGATERRYGYVHTNVNNENQWVSQNLWRDALGFYLGVGGWPQGQGSRDARYWSLEKYFATKQSGGYWDVCDYRNFAFLGASTRTELNRRDNSSLSTLLPAGNADGSGLRSCSLNEPYLQSLGYYPRGISSLSLVDASGGIALDRVQRRLNYLAAPGVVRVPVFSCADWRAENPAERIPVLNFDGNGELVLVENPSLLPGVPVERRERNIENLQAEPPSFSPDGDGREDTVTVTLDPPGGEMPATASILQGVNKIRTLTPQGNSFIWDGKDDGGQLVADGRYRIRFEFRDWGDGGYTPSTELVIGVDTTIPHTSRIWYLAEGYTGSNIYAGDFATFILAQNPNADAASIRLTLMEPGGRTTTRDFTTPPFSRLTISVDAILPAAECSALVEASQPVVVERAMYFNGWNGGHCTIGVTSPSTNWYLAEGYTAESFDEWILIQNPGAETAGVQLYLRTHLGEEVRREYLVSPRSRFTVHVDDILPASEVSAQVVSSQPVVVERAQYFNNMRSGTGSIAAKSTSCQWYFAEGYTGNGFEDWILVQNPSDQQAHIRLYFLMQGGERWMEPCTVAPKRRFTFPVHQVLPNREVSVVVESDCPVVAERAVYWGRRVEGHASLGSPFPDFTWFFAEGYTGGGFEEWLLVGNPTGKGAMVEFTFMFPDGSSRGLQVYVDCYSRFTLNVKSIVGEVEVSIRVNSSQPVVAERAIYFSGGRGGTCSIGGLE